MREREGEKMNVNSMVMLVIAGLLVVLIVSVNSSRTPVIAGTGATAGNIAAVAGNTDGSARDILYVVDTEARTLCVYDYNGGRLNLVAARNIKFDLMLDEWVPGSQQPGVKDIYKETRKKIEGGTPPSEPPKKP